MGMFDKAKGVAEDVVVKIDEKIPDSVKEKLSDVKAKVGDVVEKLEGKLPESIKAKVDPITGKFFGRGDRSAPAGDN